MSYIVSARKYRPDRFDDVVGQEHVAQTLKNALKNDKLAHAFLFCGPRGVGKTTCARILAKVLNCKNVTEEFEPCNDCESCRAFKDNASFNIIELDAASNNSVDHIRALNEQVRFQPQQGKYKIFIIDEVHMLSQSAFNAFLKTLEEPPPYAIFILATTEKHKIIPTILSRCQIFDFKRIQVPAIVEHLQKICEQEGIDAEKDALHIIAQKADGALRDALSIFDRIVSFADKKITYKDVISNLNVLDYDYYFRFTDALMTENLPQVMLIFDEVLQNGFEPDTFVNGLAAHYRDLLVCKDESTLQLLEISDNLKDKYKTQAGLIPVSFLLSSLNIANDCDLNYKMSRNKRLHTEMALIKMTFINRAVKLSQQPLEQPVPKTEQPVQPEPSTEKKTPELTAQTVVEEPKPEVAPAPILEIEKGQDTPKLMNLDALDAEIAATEQTTKKQESDVSIEKLKNAWKRYTESKENHVRTVLENTELSIEGHKIIMTVGSILAENTLRQEMGVMDFLRKELNFSDLIREIQIDEKMALANKLPKVQKPLTPKQKFQQMTEQNPLVKKVYDKFDLRLDEE